MKNERKMFQRAQGALRFFENNGISSAIFINRNKIWKMQLNIKSYALLAEAINKPFGNDLLDRKHNKYKPAEYGFKAIKKFHH